MNPYISLLLAVLLCLANALNSLAADPATAVNPATDLRGHLIKTVKIKGGDSKSDKQTEASMGALSSDGHGNSTTLPDSDSAGKSIKEEAAQEKSVDKAEEKAGEKTEDRIGEKAEEKAQNKADAKSDAPASSTACTSLPSGKRLPVQKGKAESDGTVSHGETGVDWSKWVSTLADRWYANLKNMEFRSTMVFRTKRPALIHFTCYRRGTIGNIYMRQSCGVAAYDQMQIEALKRCTPLPPFPEGSIRQSYSLLQGWECHPRQSGEQDFKPGSYGKNFPVEHVPDRTAKHQTGKNLASKNQTRKNQAARLPKANLHAASDLKTTNKRINKAPAQSGTAAATTSKIKASRLAAHRH